MAGVEAAHQPCWDGQVCSVDPAWSEGASGGGGGRQRTGFAETGRGTSNWTVGDAALPAVNTEEGVAGLGMCAAHHWFF